MSAERSIRASIGDIALRAFPTGREGDPGELVLSVENGEANGTFITPAMARDLAAILIDLAAKAERFSTAGFAKLTIP